MTFGEILPYLNKGFAVRREEYDPALIIFKQIPASFDDVSNIKSIPDSVKTLITRYGVGIDYENQFMIYDFLTGIATYCVFDGDDINAEDWEAIDPTHYNPYE
jgi:hypothetical protein